VHFLRNSLFFSGVLPSNLRNFELGYSSVSQSERNRPLGVDFDGQGGEKTKGAIGGRKNTKGAKMLNQ